MTRSKRENSLHPFETAVRELMYMVDLFEDGPPRPHPAWFDKNGKAKPDNIKKAIQSGRDSLPLHYLNSYVNPLLQNLPTVIRQVQSKQLEVLVGAVYGHGNLKHPKDQEKKDDFHFSLKCLLAMISNTYRSFLGNARLKKANLSVPTDNLPPLASFYSANAGERLVAPFILSKSDVRTWTGGPVGVVSLPTAYRDHPLLWSSVAHEIGGHELLAVQPNLLSELQEGVRGLFFAGPVPKGISTHKLSLERKMGLVWQYWTEEAASDVCGVLNVGPSYGIGLAVYQAALNAFIQLARQLDNGEIQKVDKASIKEFFEKKRQHNNDNDLPNTPFLRLWSTLHPRLVDFLEPNEALPDLDAHPVDILKVHVVIGAINGLHHLPDNIKKKYTDQLRDIAKFGSAKQSQVQVTGNIQADGDTWIPIREHFNLKEMQRAAEKVGFFIATARLPSFDGKSLQAIETWDRFHEDKVQNVSETLRKAEFAKKQEDRIIPNIENLGDDAQLIAGVTLAYYDEPEKYQFFTESLILALYTSFQRDQFWGEQVFHGTYDWTDEKRKKIVDELERREKGGKPISGPTRRSTEIQKILDLKAETFSNIATTERKPRKHTVTDGR